jgi:hypothetical protein
VICIKGQYLPNAWREGESYKYVQRHGFCGHLETHFCSQHIWQNAVENCKSPLVWFLISYIFFIFRPEIVLAPQVITCRCFTVRSFSSVTDHKAGDMPFVSYKTLLFLCTHSYPTYPKTFSPFETWGRAIPWRQVTSFTRIFWNDINNLKRTLTLLLVLS